MDIGIDLGGTNIAAAAIGEEMAILARESIPSAPSRGAEAVVGDMLALTARLIERCPGNPLRSVGIGTPGQIDRRRGEIVYSPNIPFQNTPVAPVFVQRFDVPVFIENDANTAALGELAAGGAMGYSDAVLVTLGTGIGGGIILHGKIHTGVNGCGGEIGHTVIQYNGKPCGCGRKGCWEAYASVSALIGQTREAMAACRDSLMWRGIHDLTQVSGETTFEAAKKGDRAALKVVSDYVGYLACGVANLINIFQPEVLLVGGGISREGDFLLDPLREAVEKERYTKAGVQTQIRAAVLGNDAGLYGAAMLGRSPDFGLMGA